SVYLLSTFDSSSSMVAMVDQLPTDRRMTPGSSRRLVQYTSDLCDRLVHPVVDEHVVEGVRRGHLLAGDREALGDPLAVVGAAAHQPPGQGLQVGGLQEHQQRVGEALAHLTGALHVDL